MSEAAVARERDRVGAALILQLASAAHLLKLSEANPLYVVLGIFSVGLRASRRILDDNDMQRPPLRKDCR